MAVAAIARGHGDEAELASAVNKIVATLTDARRDTWAVELRDRTTQVQWLLSSSR